MTKREYMNQLAALLDHCDEEYKADILSAIEEHFSEGLAQGRSEEEIVAELGDPREIAGSSGESDWKAEPGPGPEGDGFSDGSFSQSVTGFVNHAVNGFVSRILETVQRSVSAVSEMSREQRVRREAALAPVQNGETVTSVIISGSSADVTVGPASGEEILFDYDPYDGPEAMLNIQGNVLAISSAEQWRGLSGNLQLLLPSRVRILTVNLSSGDTRGTGLTLESLSFHTASGDVILRDVVAEELNSVTASGDLEGQEIRCRRFSARAASGDISLEGGAEYGKVNTASGDVELELRASPENIRVSTVSGDVELRVPENTGVLFRTASGEACTSRPRSHGPGGVYIGRDAPVRVEVTTVSGDLDV